MLVSFPITYHINCEWFSNWDGALRLKFQKKICIKLQWKLLYVQPQHQTVQSYCYGILCFILEYLVAAGFRKQRYPWCNKYKSESNLLPYFLWPCYMIHSLRFIHYEVCGSEYWTLIWICVYSGQGYWWRGRWEKTYLVYFLIWT